MTMTAVQALCRTAITKLDQVSQRLPVLDTSTSGDAAELDCSRDSVKSTPCFGKSMFLQVGTEEKFAGIWA